MTKREIANSEIAKHSKAGKLATEQGRDGHANDRAYMVEVWRRELRRLNLERNPSKTPA